MHVVVVTIKHVLLAVKKNRSILTGRTKTVRLGARKTKEDATLCYHHIHTPETNERSIRTRLTCALIQPNSSSSLCSYCYTTKRISPLSLDRGPVRF